MEVLSELHTLCQFHKDSKPWLPLVMAGQSALIDKMTYRASAPLASRIVARSLWRDLTGRECSTILNIIEALQG